MDEQVVSKFLRGLTIGALLGAIVAGSRIWTRWRTTDRGTVEPAVTIESTPSPEA